MLKERWRQLKSLDVRLADGWLEHALVWNVIKAAMVLHNLYIDTIDYYKPTTGWTAGLDRSDELERPLEEDTEDSCPRRALDLKNQRREEVAWLTGYYKLSTEDLQKLWPRGAPGRVKEEIEEK